MEGWMEKGEVFAASSIAWSEFLNGPVESAQVVKMEVLIQGKIIPFGREEAQFSAMLFNAAGRKRATRPDCLIAAAAICAKAPLATLNRKDFAPFVSLGLQLV